MALSKVTYVKLALLGAGGWAGLGWETSADAFSAQLLNCLGCNLLGGKSVLNRILFFLERMHLSTKYLQQ